MKWKLNTTDKYKDNSSVSATFHNIPLELILQVLGLSLPSLSPNLAPLPLFFLVHISARLKMKYSSESKLLEVLLKLTPVYIS